MDNIDYDEIYKGITLNSDVDYDGTLEDNKEVLDWIDSLPDDENTEDKEILQDDDLFEDDSVYEDDLDEIEEYEDEVKYDSNGYDVIDEFN